MQVDDEVLQLRQRIRDLEAVLGQNDKTIALRFGLPPKLSDLLGLLMAVEVATPEHIRNKLEIATDSKVVVHRLRQHMNKFNVTIHGRRGFGYWLDEDTKTWLRSAVTQEVTDGLDQSRAVRAETA